MKQGLRYILLILLVVQSFFAVAQIRAHVNSDFNLFNGTALRTSTINNGDSVVFDLSLATCVGQYFLVPISVISDDVINAVDFSMMYNNTKITYNSVINYKPVYLTPSANFNTTDSILRFTSYSFVQPIEKNVPIAAVRFNLLNGPITTANFNTVKAYLNGDRCAIKFINAVLPTAVITPGGATTIISGDSVALTANAGAGFSYLWSTSATTQTIKAFTAATYTVTVSNAGGCTANATATVFIGTPLPVQLLHFNVLAYQELVEIKWATASESNNAFFTIEHSADGLSWTELIQINSSGNSNSVINYSFTNYNPYPELNYYRLKQTDVNGLSNYLAMKSIVNITGNSNEAQVLIYPNPASEFITLKSLRDQKMQLINAIGNSGSVVINLKANKEVLLDTAELPDGVYWLKSIADISETAYKIIILKK